MIKVPPVPRCEEKLGGHKAIRYSKYQYSKYQASFTFNCSHCHRTFRVIRRWRDRSCHRYTWRVSEESFGSYQGFVHKNSPDHTS